MTAASPVIARDPRPLIAHVVYRFDTGGLENGVANLVNRLPREAYRHAIVALTEVTAFRSRIVRDDVEFIALRKPPGQGLRVFPALYREFRRLAPAIVHTRNLAALEAVLPAWLARVPACIHGEHGRDVGDRDGSNQRYRRVRRFYRPFVRQFVAVSADLERYLVDAIGVPRASVALICNGVDTTRFAPAPGGRAPIAGCPFTDPALWLVGTVGRLQAVKDQVTLAEAFVHAARRGGPSADRLRLVIVGDGPLRGAVERVLRESGLAERAWLAGERPDVPGVLRGLDCFVLPSLAEGISNTILEAMACALPVIATRVGGNGELVLDGTTGRLVGSADPAAMGQAILAAGADPGGSRAQGRAARARVLERFSLERMIDAYRGVYDRVLPSVRGASTAPSGATFATRARPRGR